MKELRGSSANSNDTRAIKPTLKLIAKYSTSASTMVVRTIASLRTSGMLFDRKRLVRAWSSADCPGAQSFYSINEAVATAMEAADRRVT